MNPRFVTFLAMLFICIGASSQNVKWDIRFQGVFDNREYFSAYNQHQTIIGGRTSISLGNKKDSIHRFRVGLSDFYNFGMRPRGFEPDLLMFYRYKRGKWLGYFGAFPEEQLLKAPRALLSDLHHYYNPTIEGILVQYQSDRFRQLTYIDWISSQDSITNECILFAGEGHVKYKKWGLENYWQIVHYGYTTKHTGSIKDYSSLALMLTYDLSSNTFLDRLVLKGGVLTSMLRDRARFDDFRTRASMYYELDADYRFLSLKSVFHYGDQHLFYLGDLFYRNTRQYSRTDLSIVPIHTKRAKLKISWCFHVANGNFENQQMLSILYKV